MDQSAFFNFIGQLGVPAAVLIYVLREYTRRFDRINETLVTMQIMVWLIANEVGVNLATSDLSILSIMQSKQTK